MRKLLLAVVLAAAAAPALAQPADDVVRLNRPAQEPKEDRGPRHARLFVSPSGEPFRGGGGLAAWFAQADADHDGAITLAEFQADAARAFKLYDANADGVIDGFEIQAYERDRLPEMSEIAVDGGGGRRGFGGGRHRGHREGGPGGDEPSGERARREGAARFSLLNEPEPLLAADEDVDGKVTLAEWKHATARRFAQLDGEHAGRLTLEGLRPRRPQK